MFGPGPRTIEKISQKDERGRILWFSLFYVIAAILQCVVVLVEAVLLGSISGAAFLLLSLALTFHYGGMFDGKRWGVYAEYTDRPPHVKFAQWVLGIVGLAILGIQIAGYWPHLWEWRVVWHMERYLVITQLFGRGWHIAPASEILTRVISTAAVPFVLWGALHTFKWAAKLELIAPTYSGTTFERMNPASVEGPEGQVREPLPRAAKPDEPDGDKPNYGIEPLKQ